MRVAAAAHVPKDENDHVEELKLGVLLQLRREELARHRDLQRVELCERAPVVEAVRERLRGARHDLRQPEQLVRLLHQIAAEVPIRRFC